MKCKFCKQEMNNYTTLSSVCKNHEDIMIISFKFKGFMDWSLCKDGIELYSDNSITELRYYRKYTSEFSSSFYLFRGYDYCKSTRTIIFDFPMIITPENFDESLEKLNKLRPFL